MNTLTHHSQYPSFSSTLLDKIYRSIDEGQTTDMNFYTDAPTTRPIHNKLTTTQNVTTRHRHRHHHHYHHNNFTSSESTSSSSGGLSSSSSDTESLYAAVRSRASSCFAPSRPKPVRTTTTTTTTTTSMDDGEEAFIKSKSRALKIYNNLKKVKQPISPGGRLTTFLNSLFNTATNSKKTTKPADTKPSSTCSSASSFSRSCLSKTSPSSTHNRLRNNNGVKRTVRFYPVSVIVGEDSRPCGHKCLYQEEEQAHAAAARVMSVSVPTAWKIGRSPSNKSDKDLKFPVMENRGFDEDDDAASDSSSDLFELDHLAVIGNHHHHHHHHRYCEELPVYETTHVTTNRAIANGLLM